MVARASLTARTTPRRSPLSRVNPALSMATSAPVPMAMPTSARARAGASLMPSPAIATTSPLPLQVLDDVELVLRPQAGSHLVDAEPRGDRLGGGLVVAGGHDDLQPERMKLGDGLGGGGLDRIGDRHQAGKLAVGAEEHHRLAVFAPGLGRGGERRDVDAGALHQPLIAEQHHAAADASRDALAGDGLRSRQPSRASVRAVRRRAGSRPQGDARCRPRAMRRGAAPRLARSPARPRRRSARACPRSASRSCRPPGS